MAILNGLYIHVTEESADRSASGTAHPVEDGLPLTDTVRENPLTISLTGQIVDYEGMTAKQVLDKIDEWKKSGTLLMYQGLNTASSMQIRSFDTDHTNKIYGGAKFSMDLVHVRIAKSAYVPKKESEKEKEDTAKKNVVIKVGDTVIFKGGPVYSASDSTKAAATRNRSTCKCTIINTRSWSVHSYHLISSDGGKVYGWVDKENIEGIVSTSTSGTTNAGTQQTKTSSSTTGSNKTTSTTNSNSSTGKYPIYHHVKEGDSLSLLCKQYNYLTPAPHVGNVINNNSGAFSGGTPKVGAYLLMGYKN